MFAEIAKVFWYDRTRACATTGPRCRRCHRGRNPKTGCERAIVGDCGRLRANDILRLASCRVLRFRFALRERKAGEAGTKPDDGSPQASLHRLDALRRRRYRCSSGGRNMKNGLYSIHLHMLDGLKGRDSGVLILRDGVLLGGGPYFWSRGVYTERQ